MIIHAARAAVMAELHRCPVCGAAVQSAEKSDRLETVAFDCEAVFFLPVDSIISVSKICSAPTYVAVRQLESQAQDMVDAATQLSAVLSAEETD